MLPLQPKYRLGHPQKNLILLSKNKILGLKYPKKQLFNFEKNFTDRNADVHSNVMGWSIYVSLCALIGQASAWKENYPQASEARSFDRAHSVDVTGGLQRCIFFQN